MKYMIETEMAFVDTSVLIYSFDKTDIKKNKKSINLLNDLISNKKLVLSNQILEEFTYVAIKKSNIPNNEIKKIIENLILTAKILNYNEKTILNSLDISSKYNLHFWDSLIIATMLENNIVTIYTENKKDFSKCNKIDVINPYEK